MTGYLLTYFALRSIFPLLIAAYVLLGILPTVLTYETEGLLDAVEPSANDRSDSSAVNTEGTFSERSVF